MTILGESLGDILDAYSDVIEGGNAYRGSGASWPGVPGVESRYSRIGEIGTLTASIVTPSTTSIPVASPPTIASNEFVKERTPPYFLHCLTASASENEGAARKISAYSGGTFTTAAFPENVQDADTFVLREGFVRVPNGVDIEELNAQDGYDRTFHISAEVGGREGWFGDGYHYYRTDLAVRLRLLKHKRARTDTESAWRNMARIQTFLTHGTYRPSAVRAVLMTGSSTATLVDDPSKIVIQATMPMIYRFSGEIK